MASTMSACRTDATDGADDRFLHVQQARQIVAQMVHGHAAEEALVHQAHGRHAHALFGALHQRAPSRSSLMLWRWVMASTTSSTAKRLTSGSSKLWPPNTGAPQMVVPQ